MKFLDGLDTAQLAFTVVAIGILLTLGLGMAAISLTDKFILVHGKTEREWRQLTPDEQRRSMIDAVVE